MYFTSFEIINLVLSYKLTAHMATSNGFFERLGTTEGRIQLYTNFKYAARSHIPNLTKIWFVT